MDIDELEVGRELDERVADFMGQPFRKPGHGSCCTCQVCGWSFDDCQCYCAEDYEKAIRVAAKIVDDTGAVMELVDYGIPQDNGKRYSCCFVKQKPNSAGLVDWGAGSWADTAPLAIYRAALKVVMNDEH